ncbi:hypothetical protein ACQY1Q_10580 [Tenacibaculum sp. TC6]|uniref:hypothetical protein n=1 Tax=Tenacibaculum sp. TC6 TaxID=3423223 RepID=UPI003D36AC2A
MEIPKLGNGKYLIMKADKKTGHILNNEGDIYINNDVGYFIVKNTKDEAIEYANLGIIENKELEFIIYDEKAEFVAMIDYTQDGASMSK